MVLAESGVDRLNRQFDVPATRVALPRDCQARPSLELSNAAEEISGLLPPRLQVSSVELLTTMDCVAGMLLPMRATRTRGKPAKLEEMPNRLKAPPTTGLPSC